MGPLRVSAPAFPIAIAFVLALAIASPAGAQWPPYGTKVSTAANIQDHVSCAPDGAGGMIIAWRDQRSDAGDIYVQRVNGVGMPLWTPDGVPLCVQPDRQFLPQIVTDGVGGAIVAWEDHRFDPLGDIYAQRISEAGVVLWAANGVPLVAGPSENVQNVSRFRMIPDGVGGAIFTFSDNRFAGGGLDPGVPKVWAQRVTSFGSPLWSPGGVPVAAGAGSYENAAPAPDGMGGVIVAWQDNSIPGEWNIVAQRLDQAGFLQWGAGVTICSAAEKQLFPDIVSDGSGGAVVAWQDNRFDPNGDIYAQRVDAGGTPLWAPDGNVLVFGASANNVGEYIIRMILDEAGGVTMAFADDRKDGGAPDVGFSKVWAQRVDLVGTPLWGNGVPVIGGPGTHGGHRIVTDTEGGSIVVWQDGTNTANLNIVAQRLSPFGTRLWGTGVSIGVSMCEALGHQTAPAAVADGLGGVLAAWSDERSGPADVYAQYVDFTGAPMSNARWECTSYRPGGVPAVITPALQNETAAAPDGAGGSIVVWRDQSADPGNIYAQRMGEDGSTLWPFGGIPICTAPGLQQQPRIVPDGIGGAIIVWQDERFDLNGDLYAQHIDGFGNVLGLPDGVPVVSGGSNNEQTASTLQLIPDGQGGAILTFQDNRRPDGVVDATRRVWAQRVSGTAGPMWGNGVPVTTISTQQEHGTLLSDGYGGAIVTWMQLGVGAWDIMAQHLDFAGTMRWGASVGICTFAGNQWVPEIASDGQGGAIISWIDFRADPNADIYAQRVNPLGSPLWAPNGVLQVGGPTHNYIPGLEDHIRMLPDNAGGAYLAFLDTRDFGGVVGASPKIWAQRVKATGSPDWGNGVAMAAGAGDHFDHSIVSDAEGGAVLVWQENPTGAWNIAAQRLHGSGSGMWTLGGVPVCSELGDQTAAAVTDDGRGHAIAAWTDARFDAGDVFAQRTCVPNRVQVSVPLEASAGASPALSAPAPNPTAGGASFTIALRRSGRVQVQLVDMRGRIVETLVDRELEPGAYPFSWAPRAGGTRLAAGVYLLRLETPDERASRKIVLLR